MIFIKLCNPTVKKLPTQERRELHKYLKIHPSNNCQCTSTANNRNKIENFCNFNKNQ
jgi:hypothetical protein